MVALWIALVVVAAVAVLALCLVLVLARRLKTVTERVNMFLPASPGSLPHPGTPIPDFSSVSSEGTSITHEDLTGEDRLIAMLTIDCASCHDQVPALRMIDDPAVRRPIVLVIGEADRRSAMVSALGDSAVVIEEDDQGPIATAFDVSEFPAVMLIRNGIIHSAGHGVAGVLASATQP